MTWILKKMQMMYMSEEWEYIDLFEGLMNLIALPFFIIGFVFILFVYLNKKTASRAILALLMFGGCLFSIGEVIEVFVSFEYYPELDELGDSYNIFLASILLVLGVVVSLEEKLKVSEQKFKHLFENSPYSVVMLELKGKIIDCNIATNRLFGYKKVDIVDRDFTKFFSDPSKLLVERINVMKKGKKSIRPIELKILKANNVSVWVNLQTSLFKIHDETFIQIILRDITERKKAEDIIKEEMKKLKEIDQIRSDFVRRTSHELKTPLISIYSSTQYLQERYKNELNEDMSNIIESINRGGERLNRLTENLLDVFNLETNVFTLRKEKIDLVKIIKEVSEDFSSMLKDRKIILKLELNDTCYIQADKIRIEQIIINILSNAIKNTPLNGLIYISINKTSDYVEIIFKDSGIGLTEVEKGMIFKKFGKIERRDIEKDIVIEGSGLGLFISKQIVELHGGNIWVESEGRNKGSSFTIRLPINETN